MLTGVTQVAAHIGSMALRQDGTVWVWGDGQLRTCFRFPTDVTVDCETFGAVIHYTTTGVEPTESDPVILAGNSLRIDRTTTLKVKAWKPGLTGNSEHV